jgi:hypothetical protein
MKSANCSPVAPQGNRVSVVMGRATIAEGARQSWELVGRRRFAGVGWLLGQRPVLAFRTGGPIRKVRKGSTVVLGRREQRLRGADSAPTGRFRKDPNGAEAVVPLRARSPTWPAEELPLRGIAAAAAEKRHRICHESGVANVLERPYRATCCSPPRYRRNGISNS